MKTGCNGILDFAKLFRAISFVALAVALSPSAWAYNARPEFAPSSGSVNGNNPAAGSFLSPTVPFETILSGPSNMMPEGIKFKVIVISKPAGFTGNVADWVTTTSGELSTTSIGAPGDDPVVINSLPVSIQVKIPHLDFPAGSVPVFVFKVRATDGAGVDLVGPADFDINASITIAPDVGNPVPPTIAFLSPTPADNHTFSYNVGDTQTPVKLKFSAVANADYPITSIDLTISGTAPNGITPITVPAFELAETGINQATALGETTLPIPLPAGTYQVIARGANGVGAPVSTTTHFKVALTGPPPAVAIALPLLNSVHTYTVPLAQSVNVPASFTATTPSGTTLDRWSATLTKPDGSISTAPLSYVGVPAPTSWTGTTPLDLTLTGSYTLSVTAWNNLGVSATATTTFTVNVIKATPLLTWPTPAPVIYGTPVSSTQLNASATVLGQPVAGTYAYTPSSGSVLGAGDRTLGVTFTPSNPSAYQPISGSVVLKVLKAPLTVHADDKTKVYGDANPGLTYSITGFVNKEILGTSGVTGTPVLTTVAAASNVGANHPIVVAQGSLESDNYSFTLIDGKLVITPAVLTVTAGSANKIYGDPNPTAYTFGVTGYKNSDTSVEAYAGSPGFTTSASLGSIPGSYAVSPTLGGLTSTNYTFAFVDGVLTVEPAVLTFTAINATKVYGSANPPLLHLVSGYKNGDLAATAFIGTPSVSTTATNSSPYNVSPGYPITISAGTGAGAMTSAKYTFAFVPAVLTVTKAAITVAANDATKVLNAALPTFTSTITGFVAGDTSSILNGKSPSLTTSATQASPIGSYAIVAAQGQLPALQNYDYVFKDGTLTVSEPSTFAIAGVVYLDLNKDGTRNGAEPGIGGVTVTLKGSITGTATTNGVGAYSFTVPAGTYEVGAIEPGLSPTDTNARMIDVTTSSGPQNFGLYLNFTAMRSLKGDGHSHGYWKMNLTKALPPTPKDSQETVLDLEQFSAEIGNNLALPLFNGMAIPAAVATMSGADQLALQLLASEYNYISGRLINGSIPLTAAFIHWGEHVHTNSSSAADREFAKNWMDAFNNSYGGAVAGPRP